MCVVGAIVGEFIASDKGLGFIIIASQYTMETEDTDRMVTIDTSRLIRLPDTIHGGSGLVAKHVTDLDRFDPLTDGARIRRHKHKDKHQGTCPRL